MQTRLNPYINFKDNAREAMEFYKSVFGGKLTMCTFGEYQMSQNPSDANKVMHSMLEAENGIVFMASDAPEGMEITEGSNMNMSLSGDNKEELTGYWNKLSEGGTQILPLVPSPWGDEFGMVKDKFGITWMVNITEKK